MKLLFDATFGEPWVNCLRGFFQNHRPPRPQIRHFYDMFGDDEKDDPVWIPKLVKLSFIVVSADRGKHSRVSERLLKICRDHGITHILLSSGMHEKANKFERARAIIVLWHDILKTGSDSPGSRYLIGARDGSYTRFELRKKPLTDSKEMHGNPRSGQAKRPAPRTRSPSGSSDKNLRK